VPSPVDDGCSRPQPAIAVTRPDEATTVRVNAAWARIEAVLAAKAPRVAASLRPGANADALLTAHVRMGVAFPADLVASLQRHDGATWFMFPPFHRFLALDETYRQWLTTCRTVAGAHLGDDWWHRSFVPFAAAGDGGYLVLDQRPGSGGRVGDYDPEEGTRFEGRPRSLTEMLEAVATSMETGQPYAGRYRPEFTPGGTLHWVG
jgi:cell wall assembly regulator SMI1